MNDKSQILTALRAEFNRWEVLLAGLSEAQITSPQLASDWSVRDVIAHLWAWQQRSIARMEAALHHTEPAFPEWPAELDPEVEEQPDQLNAWLYETSRDKPWAQVYSDWRQGFLHLIESGEAIPESDLMTPGRYTWLEAYPLSRILTASREHHEEHHDWLLDWLREHGVV